jgi:hypothetical protein
LFALFLRALSAVIGSFDGIEGQTGWRPKILWVILVAAALLAGWEHAEYGTDAPVFVALAVGLTFLAKKVSLPLWAAGVLQSPALLAFGFAIGASLSVFAFTAKAATLLQLGMLLAALYLPRTQTRNPEQA